MEVQESLAKVGLWRGRVWFWAVRPGSHPSVEKSMLHKLDVPLPRIRPPSASLTDTSSSPENATKAFDLVIPDPAEGICPISSAPTPLSGEPQEEVGEGRRSVRPPRQAKGLEKGRTLGIEELTPQLHPLTVRERERESDYLSLFLMAKMELQASSKEGERGERKGFRRITRKQPKAFLPCQPCRVRETRGSTRSAPLSCCRKKERNVISPPDP